jgi:hypothetical protein
MKENGRPLKIGRPVIFCKAFKTKIGEEEQPPGRQQSKAGS